MSSRCRRRRSAGGGWGGGSCGPRLSEIRKTVDGRVRRAIGGAGEWQRGNEGHRGVIEMRGGAGGERGQRGGSGGGSGGQRGVDNVL